MPKTIAVIGSGIGGLSAALHLRRKGARVVVFEKNSWIGGKLRSFEKQGFRFDKGPSLFTLPHLVDEIFELFGENPRAFYSYKKLPIACKYFDSNGAQFTAYTDEKEMLAEVERVFGSAELESVSKYLKISSENLELSKPLFVENDKGLLSADGLRMMLYAKQMGIFTSLNAYNTKRLNHPFLIKIFNRFATYNGSNPYEAPAVLNCIPALEHGEGTYFPEQGIVGIVDAMVSLGHKVGVEFEINKTITSIDFEGKKVVLNKSERFDGVVINGDYYTSQKLLPKKYQVTSPKQSDLSSSGLVFYWGVNGVHESLDVHNIFFSEDYEKEFEHLHSGELSEDLTVYVHISSKVVSNDAPGGKENWFVMVNVPAKELPDHAIVSIKNQVIQKLNHQLNIKLETKIETEEVFTPQLIQQDTSGFRGALYGMHSNSLKHMMSRPKNRSKIDGVYYAGGTVFPGGGIPLCMSSGKLAAHKIEEDGLVD